MDGRQDVVAVAEVPAHALGPGEVDDGLETDTSLVAVDETGSHHDAAQPVAGGPDPDLARRDRIEAGRHHRCVVLGDRGRAGIAEDGHGGHLHQGGPGGQVAQDDVQVAGVVDHGGQAVDPAEEDHRVGDHDGLTQQLGGRCRQMQLVGRWHQVRVGVHDGGDLPAEALESSHEAVGEGSGASADQCPSRAGRAGCLGVHRSSCCRDPASGAGSVPGMARPRSSWLSAASTIRERSPRPPWRYQTEIATRSAVMVVAPNSTG